MLSIVVNIDDEINAMNAKASAAFGRLRGSVWDQSGIRLDTSLKSTNLWCYQQYYTYGKLPKD